MSKPKTIDTLVEDMQRVMLTGEGWTEELSTQFAADTASMMMTRMHREERKPYLRFSNLGESCLRRLWYQIASDVKGEPFSARALTNFLYGDILELLLLYLARAAGHRVEGTQGQMTLRGLVGSRDCVIDGVLLDAKSASGRAFVKFLTNALREDDPFGYLPQLSGYLKASEDDPLVTVKDRAGFLVFNKENGAICLDIYDLTPELAEVEDKIEDRKRVVAPGSPMPPRGEVPVPQSKTSPNTKLSTKCSYCEFKAACWPEARKFIYSFGPVWLVDVVKEPNVMEVIE